MESRTIPFYVPEFWSDAIVSTPVSAFIKRSIVLVNPRASEADVLRHLGLIQDALKAGRPVIPEEDAESADLIGAGL